MASTPSHPWLIDKSKPVIISVGRLAKEKNYPLLLEAFAQLRREIDARLIILGEGPQRAKIQNMIFNLGIEEYVSLPGKVMNPWSFMAKSDIFVLPSYVEAFGLVLVEAMICGIPIVATDAIGGGPRYVLQNGKYGVLVENENVEELKISMKKVLSDPRLKSSMIELGKKRVIEFSPSRIAQKWLDYFRELYSLT